MSFSKALSGYLVISLKLVVTCNEEKKRKKLVLIWCNLFLKLCKAQLSICVVNIQFGCQ